MGVGRPLINKAIEIAQKQKCQAIAVWPTQDAIPFYMKSGLNQIAYKIHQIEIDLTKVNPPKENTKTSPAKLLNIW